MKSLKTVLIYCFVSFSLYAQEEAGEVMYKVDFVNQIEVADSSSTRIKNTFIELKEDAKNLAYILVFNTEKSHYYLKRDLNRKNSLAEALFGNGDYYYDVNNKISLKKKNGALVENTTDFKWNLSQESIMISGFKCYLATTVMEYNVYGNRKAQKKVFAWYCPEINFPYGPRGYGGLGLNFEASRQQFNILRRQY